MSLSFSEIKLSIYILFNVCILVSSLSILNHYFLFFLFLWLFSGSSHSFKDELCVSISFIVNNMSALKIKCIWIYPFSHTAVLPQLSFLYKLDETARALLPFILFFSALFRWWDFLKCSYFALLQISLKYAVLPQIMLFRKK